MTIQNSRSNGFIVFYASMFSFLTLIYTYKVSSRLQCSHPQVFLRNADNTQSTFLLLLSSYSNTLLVVLIPAVPLISLLRYDQHILSHNESRVSDDRTDAPARGKDTRASYSSRNLRFPATSLAVLWPILRCSISWHQHRDWMVTATTHVQYCHS